MRVRVWQGVLLGWLLIGTVHAGEVILGFDFDLAKFPGTTFRLKQATVARGVTVAREVPLTLFTPQQCAAWPDKAHTPTSLCAPLCLEPGEHSVKVYAKRGGQTSDESNVLDIVVTSTTGCRTIAESPVPVPAPPRERPAPDRLGPVPGGIAGGIAAGVGESREHIGFPMDLVNLACVQWAITGPCLCGPTTPCVTVEYWEPGWIVETVKRPGTTALDPASALLDTVWKALGVPALGGGGSGNASGAGHTNLQYHEAHVMEFPQILGGPCTGCAPTPRLTIHYASETDAAAWRTAVAVPTPRWLGPAGPANPPQLGDWGPLYPRGGKSITASEPVGSGIAAARAMNIAFMPIGLPPNVDTHVVLNPTGADSRCCQLASPRHTACMPVGTNPVHWEIATVSPRGTYVWLMWRKRTCCVDPSKATCGLTLIGGHGRNVCIPSPSP